MTGDFNGGAMPSALKPYDGFSGYFMTGMDLDGEGASLPIEVNWTGIDISGLPTLVLAGTLPSTLTTLEVLTNLISSWLNIKSMVVALKVYSLFA